MAFDLRASALRWASACITASCTHTHTHEHQCSMSTPSAWLMIITTSCTRTHTHTYTYTRTHIHDVLPHVTSITEKQDPHTHQPLPTSCWASGVMAERRTDAHSGLLTGSSAWTQARSTRQDIQNTTHRTEVYKPVKFVPDVCRNCDS